MKRWRMGLLACLVATCMGVALVGCQSETYTPPSKSPTVSGPALGEQGTLRVGIDASSLPLAGKRTNDASVTGNDRYDGIDPYVAYFIGDELGLNVQLVDVGKDPSTALNEGVADVVLGVDDSSDDADYWRSTPYIQTSVALFGMASESAVPTPDSKPAIAATVSTKSSWRVSKLFGDESLVTTENLSSAFEQLNSGTVRYVAVDALAGLYTVNQKGYSNKIVALLQDPSGYCAAVAEDNTELQGAITSALGKLTSGGVINIIEERILGATADLGSYTIVKSAAADAPKADAASDDAEDGQEGDADSEESDSTEDEESSSAA